MGLRALLWRRVVAVMSRILANMSTAISLTLHFLTIDFLADLFLPIKYAGSAWTRLLAMMTKKQAMIFGYIVQLTNFNTGDKVEGVGQFDIFWARTPRMLCRAPCRGVFCF